MLNDLKPCSSKQKCVKGRFIFSTPGVVGVVMIPRMKSFSVTIQIKATERHFCAQFIMLYKVVQTCDSADEILKCDHSNESY